MSSRRRILRMTRGRMGQPSSGPDITGPVRIGAVTSVDGLSVTYTFNEQLKASSVPDAGDFTFSGTTFSSTGVSVGYNTVTVTGTPAIENGETVLGSYTAGSNPIKDVAGNNTSNWTNVSVSNMVPGAGALVTLESSTDGLSLVATYSSAPAPDDNFTLGGTPVLVIGADVVGSVRTLELDSPILGSETVTLSSDLLTDEAVDNLSDIELEVVAEMYRADWSLADTEYCAHRPIRFIAWGGGGGGAGNGTTGGAGAGGQTVITDVSDAAAGGYSGVVGTGGAVDTVGNDSTVTQTVGSTVIVRAKGGAPGVPGTGGTGSVADGVGDTVRAGGNGGSGTGNLVGGATSGSATAASTSTPGGPEGTRTLSTQAGFMGAGGGVTSGGASPQAGGNGWHLVIYRRAVDVTTRPYVAGFAYGRDPSNAASRDVAWSTFGSAPVAGDVGVVLGAQDGASGGASMAGMTELTDIGSATALLAYVGDLDGSGDPVALATASEIVGWITYTVRGCSGAANVTAESTAQGNVDDPDPAAEDHGASVDALVVTCLAGDQGSSAPLSIDGFPAGYSNRMLVPAISNGATLAACLVGDSAQIFDAGAWTTSGQNVNGGTSTIVLPKA